MPRTAAMTRRAGHQRPRKLEMPMRMRVASGSSVPRLAKASIILGTRTIMTMETVMMARMMTMTG